MSVLSNMQPHSTNSSMTAPFGTLLVKNTFIDMSTPAEDSISRLQTCPALFAHEPLKCDNALDDASTGDEFSPSIYQVASLVRGHADSADDVLSESEFYNGEPRGELVVEVEANLCSPCSNDASPTSVADSANGSECDSLQYWNPRLENTASDGEGWRACYSRAPSPCDSARLNEFVGTPPSSCASGRLLFPGTPSDFGTAGYPVPQMGAHVYSGLEAHVCSGFESVEEGERSMSCEFNFVRPSPNGNVFEITPGIYGRDVSCSNICNWHLQEAANPFCLPDDLEVSSPCSCGSAFNTVATSSFREMPETSSGFEGLGFLPYPVNNVSYFQPFFGQFMVCSNPAPGFGLVPLGAPLMPSSTTVTNLDVDSTNVSADVLGPLSNPKQTWQGRPVFTKPTRATRSRQVHTILDEFCCLDFDAVDATAQSLVVDRLIVLLKCLFDEVRYWEADEQHVVQNCELLGLSDFDVQVLELTLRTAQELVEDRRYRRAFNELLSLRSRFSWSGRGA